MVTSIMNSGLRFGKYCKMMMEFVAVIAFCCILTTNAALAGQNGYVLTPFDNAEITCQSSTPPTPPLRWFKNGVEIVSKAGKYDIRQANSSLEVVQVGEADAGPYVCAESATSNATATIFVAAYASANRSQEITQGQDLVVVCDAWGFGPPKVTWYANGKTVVADGVRTIIEDIPTKHNNLTIRGGKLTILQAKKSDSAKYTCQAQNAIGDYNATTSVRVKDPLAWIWPVIGIVLLTLLLAALCGLAYYVYRKYSRRRNRKIRLNN